MGVDISSLGIPKFDQLDIVKEGVLQVSISSSPTNYATLAHNLGYTPVVMAFLNNVNISSIFTDGDIPLPTWTSLTVDTAEPAIDFKTYVQAAVDSTNLYILAFNATGATGGTFDVKYYLLAKRTR